MIWSARDAEVGRVPSSRLREVVPSDEQAVAWAARLHRELFSDIGLIAQLGDRLLRRVCYTRLISDQLMRATVVEVNGEPAGLVAYTTDSKAVHTAVSGRYLGFVLREAILSLFLDPRIILGVPGAARLLFERRNERIEADRPVAEILAIGVRAPFRTPEFIRETGLRVGDLLLTHALASFKQAGFKEARGVVLADNRPALMFFRMRASRVEPYACTARPSYQVWFDVEMAPRATQEAAAVRPAPSSQAQT
jgi:ribosomal protein S18 acetylase RimI-like enzyme